MWIVEVRLVGQRAWSLMEICADRYTLDCVTLGERNLTITEEESDYIQYEPCYDLHYRAVWFPVTKYEREDDEECGQ